jgi:hypothetical protein
MTLSCQKMPLPCQKMTPIIIGPGLTLDSHNKRGQPHAFIY